MEPLVRWALIGFPVVWHLAFTAYVYQDAGGVGLNPRRWAAITFLLPLLGFFAYLFTKDERTLPVDAEQFAEGPYRVHRSRRKSEDDGSP